MMATLKTKPRKTVEDYMRLPEGTRAELIEGEIFMSPSPKRRHQEIVENVFRLLDPHVRSHQLGKVHLSPLDVHFPTGDVTQPDVIFVTQANASILRDWIRGAPDLLVEVLSPETRANDLIIKRDKYAENRVKEYWIVDDDTRSVLVKRLSGDSFIDHGYFGEEDTFASPLLPGLEVPVRRIFE